MNSASVRLRNAHLRASPAFIALIALICGIWMAILFRRAELGKQPIESPVVSSVGTKTAVPHDDAPLKRTVPVIRDVDESSDLDNTPEPPIDHPATPEDYKRWFDMQVSYCGKLCTVDKSKLPKPPIVVGVNFLKKHFKSTPVRCPTFFSKRAESLYDGKRLEWPPPKEAPINFALHDEPIENWRPGRHDYTDGVALTPVWPKEQLEADAEKFKTDDFDGPYGRAPTRDLLALLRTQDLKGKRVLIVGTERPWVEAMVLSLEPKEIVTLEYGKIETDHPKLRTMTPLQANDLYRRGDLEPFDLAISFSSLEHSGLGRYADIINPWGDVIWMAKISCMVKKGGAAIVAVEDAPLDKIFYYAHRVYGPYRWPYFLQNWEATYVKQLHDRHNHALVLAINRREDA